MASESRTKFGIALRDVADDDLEVFFQHENDPEAIRMAAFTAKDPSDRSAFDAHWKKIRGDENITIKTVLVDDKVAGHVASFLRDGTPEVTYWLGREYWGRGAASAALALFLQELTGRPLYARVAKDNGASIRVLEKCGFEVSGEDKGFAEGRGEEVEEFIMELKG